MSVCDVYACEILIMCKQVFAKNLEKLNCVYFDIILYKQKYLQIYNQEEAFSRRTQNKK